MIYCGIDLHSNNMVNVAIDGNRKVIREVKLPASRTVVGKKLANGVWHMLSKDQQYKGFKGQPTRVAPRTYWPQPINPSA